MPLANPITCTSTWTEAKFPTIRACCSARRIIGEASPRSGEELGPKKLIGGEAGWAHATSSFSDAACARFPARRQSTCLRGGKADNCSAQRASSVRCETAEVAQLVEQLIRNQQVT